MKFRTLVRNLLCLLAFLGIPRHFALQAKEVPSNCEASRAPIVSVHSEPEDEESISPIAIPPPAYSAAGRRGRSNDELSVMSTSQTFQPIQRFESAALELGWSTCVDHWCKLWRIIASVAFTILVGSSPLLQKPGTSGDPLTRCFAFLFILRLVSSLLSAAVLLYYFSKKHFCSGTFAMIWYQIVKRYDQSYFCMPWIIVALPVIAISWGAIFMLITVFLSVWGDGLYLNLSPIEEVSPLTIMSLRVIVTGLSVVDVGWVSWLVVKLKAFEKAVKAAQDSAA